MSISAMKKREEEEEEGETISEVVVVLLFVEDVADKVDGSIDHKDETLIDATFDLFEKIVVYCDASRP